MSLIRGEIESVRRTTLLNQLFNGNCDLQRWAHEHQMTLEQLAAWGGDESLLESVQKLRRLADAQARLLISRCRLSAVGKLLKIVESAEGETARRACVDLLRLEMSLETKTGGGEVTVHLTSIDIQKHQTRLEIIGKGDGDADRDPVSAQSNS